MRHVAVALGLVGALLTVGLQAQAEVTVPAAVLSEMTFLVGEWDREGEVDGKPFTGKYSAKWAPGQYCLILTAKEDLWVGSGVGGWDPSTSEYVETWYALNGSRVELRYRMSSAGAGWGGTSITHYADGRTEKGVIRLSKVGGDAFTYMNTTGGSRYAVRAKRTQK